MEEGNSCTMANMAVDMARQIIMLYFKVLRTRSYLSAPTFCPVMEATDMPTAVAGIWAKLLTLEASDTPDAALTPRLLIMEETIKNPPDTMALWIASGSPS